jgi:hypothetical protein
MPPNLTGLVSCYSAAQLRQRRAIGAGAERRKCWGRLAHATSSAARAQSRGFASLVSDALPSHFPRAPPPRLHATVSWHVKKFNAALLRLSLRLVVVGARSRCRLDFCEGGAAPSSGGGLLAPHTCFARQHPAARAPFSSPHLASHAHIGPTSLSSATRLHTPHLRPPCCRSAHQESECVTGHALRSAATDTTSHFASSC